MTYTENILLTTIVCGKCGVTFAMPETLRKERQQEGGDVYCPNGHPRVYRETDVERERKLRVEAEKRAEEALRLKQAAEAASRLHREEADKALKAQERLKKRASAGVCPCCNRTFQNLARHMNVKHAGEEKRRAAVAAAQGGQAMKHAPGEWEARIRAAIDKAEGRA